MLTIADIKKSPEYAEIKKVALEKAVNTATLKFAGFFDRLSLIIIGLKLAGMLEWSWWVVSIPIIIHLLIEIISFVACLRGGELVEIMQYKMADEKIKLDNDNNEVLYDMISKLNKVKNPDSDNKNEDEKQN